MISKAFWKYGNSNNQPMAIDDIDCYYIDKEFNAIILVMKDDKRVSLRENKGNKQNIIKATKTMLY